MVKIIAALLLHAPLAWRIQSVSAILLVAYSAVFVVPDKRFDCGGGACRELDSGVAKRTSVQPMAGVTTGRARG